MAAGVAAAKPEDAIAAVAAANMTGPERYLTFWAAD